MLDTFRNSSYRLLEPVWPLPSVDGRAPVAKPADPTTAGHDLVYSADAKHFYMPDSLPAFVVADGVITYCGKQLHGYAVVIDHGNGWASYYANLEHVFAKLTNRGPRARGERVKTGHVIGYVGAPAPDQPKCLHFELWKLGAQGHFEPVDALPMMQTWLLLPWQETPLTPSQTNLPRVAA